MLAKFRKALGAGPQPALGPVHPIHPGWGEYTGTLELASGDRLRLRPLTFRDGKDWCLQRQADREFLEPVEPTVEETWAQAHSIAAWRGYFFTLRQSAEAGFVVPLVIEVNGDFAGQVTLGNIQRGIVSECWIGYWVFSQYHRRGIATAACALGTDHAFSRIGLHRVTATYLPENEASGKVLAHSGFRKEGYLKSNLHINGRWRDHVLVALTEDEFVDSCTGRLIASGAARRVTGDEV